MKQLELVKYSDLAKEPAKRIDFLKKKMDDCRPMLDNIDVQALQSDRLYANVDIVYMSQGPFFEVHEIQELS
jgi:hypothetical protein